MAPQNIVKDITPVLFRLILISCTCAPSWKHALVQPVPKKGDRSNDRPIPLTSAVAKAFKILLNSHFIKHLESKNLSDHFIKHLESKNLLSDHQFGLRKERSTEDLLSYLTHA